MRILSKKKTMLFCVVLLLAGIHANSQSNGQLYKQGLIAFYEENFRAAENYFSKIQQSGKSYKDSEYRLEISKLVQNKNRDEPLTTILQYSDKEKSDKFYHYWMGRVYANKYMFAEAVDSWNKFLENKSDKSDEILKETNGFIVHARQLVEFFDNPDNYEIHQLNSPINTEYAEVSPMFLIDSDELIFASNRNNEKLFEIFEATNSEDGWSEPAAIKALGTFPRENANLQIVYPAGKLFTFKKASGGGLFYSERQSTGWTTPVEFDAKISTSKLESHFFINEHQDRILFASQTKSNGLDLMESFKNPQTGEWDAPHAFASAINSTFDEDSPFLSADEKTLYFASNREGLGGYDIYISTLDEKTQKWSAPENMGWPINSPDDDIHFKLNKDQKSGYLSSNRLHSKGDFDIYFFWRIQKTKIEGRIIDAITGEPLKEGEIRFNPSQYLDEYFRSYIASNGRYSVDVISNETFRVEVHISSDTLLLSTFTVEPADGELVTNFKDFYVNSTEESMQSKYRIQNDNIVAMVQGEKFNKSETTKSDEKKKTEKPDKKGTEKPVAASSLTDSKKAETITEREVRETPTNFTHKNTILKNIYFSFGTSRLESESEPRLNELLAYMQQFPDKKIEITGHTDNVGSAQTNLIVSQRRAEAVKTWLVVKGISADRILTNGFGEAHPLASNDDEIDGREINRRIEINILE